MKIEMTSKIIDITPAIRERIESNPVLKSSSVFRCLLSHPM